MYDPPRWWVTLRVPPGPATRGGAMTIPVEVSEFQPGDITAANEIAHLLPTPATPDVPPPFSWEFAHGLGMLLRPDNPVPVKTYVMRPDRISGASVRVMVGALAPKLRADAEFQQRLKYLGVAVFGLKDGEDLSAVFPGVPLTGGTTKLGDKLAQLHYKSSFPTIPVEAVTAAKPPNVTADSLYKFEAVDPVFGKALAADGIGSIELGNGVKYANDQVDNTLNAGAGANADDRNNKAAIQQIRFEMGEVPRGSDQFAFTLNVSRTPAGNSDTFYYDVHPFAGGDGVVDFRGWCQISETVENRMDIKTTLLAVTDQAELRSEMTYLTLCAWRMKQFLNADCRTEANDAYPLVQTLLRINEPLWEYLALRRVLQLHGPRLKKLGDELVPQLDPVSVKIWQDRYMRAEAFINSVETVRATFKDAPGGLDEDNFHPLCDDQLAYEMNRVWLSAIRANPESYPNVPIVKTAPSAGAIVRIQQKLSRSITEIVAKGFHRGARPVPLKAVLDVTQPKAKKNVTDPELEPDLQWLARVCTGLKPFSKPDPDNLEFDTGPQMNGFVRPFMMMGTSFLTERLKRLLSENIFGVIYKKDGQALMVPPNLPKDTFFRYVDRQDDMRTLISALSSMVQVCKPETLSERVRTDGAGKTAGFTQTWFDGFKTSVASTKPVTALDTETFDYLRLKSALDAELVKVGRDLTTVPPQYFVYKQAAKLTDGLVFAGAGTESAASAALRKAVLINLELIGKYLPPGEDTTDLALQRGQAQQAFVEQAMLRQALRAGDELMFDLWDSVLNDARTPVTPSHTRLRSKGKLAAELVGAKCVLIKKVSGSYTEEQL